MSTPPAALANAFADISRAFRDAEGTSKINSLQSNLARSRAEIAQLQQALDNERQARKLAEEAARRAEQDFIEGEKRLEAREAELAEIRRDREALAADLERMMASDGNVGSAPAAQELASPNLGPIRRVRSLSRDSASREEDDGHAEDQRRTRRRLDGATPQNSAATQFEFVHSKWGAQPQQALPPLQDHPTVCPECGKGPYNADHMSYAHPLSFTCKYSRGAQRVKVQLFRRADLMFHCHDTCGMGFFSQKDITEHLEANADRHPPQWKAPPRNPLKYKPKTPMDPFAATGYYQAIIASVGGLNHLPSS
ncbi:hypothetical protein FB451DRAFT_1261567 [Mycena latifolia]|nr:hypothetical protein FB451DRAFT_1261567 [Mycena latifolia]